MQKESSTILHNVTFLRFKMSIDSKNPSRQVYEKKILNAMIVCVQYHDSLFKMDSTRFEGQTVAFSLFLMIRRENYYLVLFVFQTSIVVSYIQNLHVAKNNIPVRKFANSKLSIQHNTISYYIFTSCSAKDHRY